MKILYHHRTQAEDGQAVHIRALQQAFEQEGHTVQEVSLVNQGAAPTEGRSKWGWVTKLPRFALELAEYSYSVPARRNLMRSAHEFQPDFIYERYAFGNAGGVMAASKLKKPLVLEVNSPMVVELTKTRGLAFPGVARKLENSIFKGADRVCVVTRVLGDMLEELGVEPERLLVTPNGVHLELYDVTDPSAARSNAWKALGIEADPDEVVLGFVGYYRDWHRLDLAIEALRMDELARARLAIIGEGPAHEDLVSCAARAGVSDRVHFCGRRAHVDIPSLLPAFDLALIPAINPYASPLKLHEYMAASLPVVAPNQPNLREVLEHEQNGYLVEPGDGEAFQQALQKLVPDGALRASLGSAARKTIEDRDLTWRGNARRVVASVEELIR